MPPVMHCPSATFLIITWWYADRPWRWLVWIHGVFWWFWVPL